MVDAQLVFKNKSNIMKSKISLLILITTLFLNIKAQNDSIISSKPAQPEKIIQDPSLTSQIQAVHDLTVYPNLPNMVKNVIFLDPMPYETLLKVEFYAVKSLEVDECNKHYLFGDFAVKTLEGYGYPYYVFNTNSQVISTKMGCGNDVKKVKNVSSGKTEIVRYMSILPIVIYSPKEIDIKYKIWKQDPKELDARTY
jgi:ecotin